VANPDVEQILEELGHAIEPDHSVWLHHATTQQAAAAIRLPA
jgi:hypothetical protein